MGGVCWTSWCGGCRFFTIEGVCFISCLKAPLNRLSQYPDTLYSDSDNTEIPEVYGGLGTTDSFGCEGSTLPETLNLSVE